MKPRASARRERTPVKLSPQLERRRALRRDKRRELLIQLWRVLVLLLAGAGLGWLLLRTSWTLQDSEQVVVNGDTGISGELVARVGGLRFPQPLLAINPADLEQRLLNGLPVRSVSVERRGFPARVEIDLLGQLPIAHATRQRNKRIEKGMVDVQGHWIQPRADTPSRVPSSTVTVEGWTPERRLIIAELLRQRSAIGKSLQTITLHADGSISLRTSELGTIQLGSDINLLPKQVAVIGQLTRSMPQRLINRKTTNLDLSNPERPELELPNKVKSVTEQTNP